MDQQMLDRLAEFLQVEATPQAVHDGLMRLCTQMETMMPAMEPAAEGAEKGISEPPNTPEGVKAVAQVEAIKSVSGVNDLEGVRQLVTSWLKAIEAEQPKPVNVDALKSFHASFEAAAHKAPAVSTPLPKQVDASKSGNRLITPFVMGKAVKPSLGGMVADIKAGKAANYEVGVLGGYIVRQELVEEMISLLRAQLVLEQAGVGVQTIEDTAVFSVPRMSAASTAYWVGVNKTVPDSDNEWENLTVIPKPVAALAKIPNRMMKTMYAGAEKKIQDEILKSIRLKIEHAALLGTGAVTGSNNGAEPVGLLNLAGVTKTALGSGNGATPSIDDALKMFERIEGNNVELTDAAKYIMHSRDRGTYSRATDANGQPLLRPSFADPRRPELDGKQVLTTNQIPTDVTVGTSTNTSYIFAGEWSQMELYLGGAIEIVILDQLYAAQLQTGVLAYTYADVLVHHEEAFEVLTGVKPTS